jgi:proline racemase
MKVDIAYGGCYFAVINANELGLKVKPSEVVSWLILELGLN